MKLKKFLAYLMLSGGVLGALTSCNNDDDGTDPEPEPGTAGTVTITASPNGTGTRTLYNDTTYVLNGLVFVNSGQTLTIEPGTIIRARPGQGTQASALIIARGARILAEGTQEQPIIFTAEEDVDFNSTTDVPVTAKGLWGGVIILGSAPINTASGEAGIEGIAASGEPRIVYGGNNPNDNSGIFRYVSIRHNGSIIGGNNEINGLTLGGVGAGTTVEYVEVFSNLDDGFEFFGGTVNTRYLAAFNVDDDGFDWDQGFSGENQFWVAVQDPSNNPLLTAGSRGGELDGAASDNLNTPNYSRATVYNATFIGAKRPNNTNIPTALFMTENPGGRFYNSIFMYYDLGIQIPADFRTDPNTGAVKNFNNGTLDFQNNIWFNVADNTVNGIAGGFAELATELTNGNNLIQDPQLGAVPNTIAAESQSLDLVPVSASVALSAPRFALPSGTPNGFNYTQANFIGAFGSGNNTNWLKGWTAADAYGLLK